MEQLTLSIIKPDALRAGLNNQINDYITKDGLEIVKHKALLLTRAQAEEFYCVHKGTPFFEDLISLMTSGPLIVQVLKGEGSISRYRQLMGATDPKKAEKGTIRGDLAENIDENRVHGSDSEENAKREIGFFFACYELVD